MQTSTENSNLIWRLRLFVVAAGLMVALSPLFSRAQDAVAPPTGVDPAAAQPAATDDAPIPLAEQEMPSVWNLAVQGGFFMIPIGLASVVVIAFALERTIGLRSRRIIPPQLLSELESLDAEGTGIDPRAAYKVCQESPSPLGAIVRAAVLKIGRPHSEVEKAVEDAVARETSEMMRNMRPINVVASIAPLLGLIGTVQGMIMAFMVTSTTSSTGTGKAQELAQGIYTALVTTFAGLCVAVVAVLVSNWLESRIERLLRDMEEIFLEIVPQFERYEGKVRVTRASGQDGSESSGVLLKGRSNRDRADVQKPAAARTRPSQPQQPPARRRPAPKSVSVPEPPGIDDDDSVDDRVRNVLGDDVLDDSVEDEYFAEAAPEQRSQE
jgi:biopolymer transport protein ExbB